MKNGYKVLREMVFHNPLGLKTLDSTLTKIADSYLPYSVGIEIECSLLHEDNANEFLVKSREIPFILHTYHDMHEKRFRIPPGVPGMICLHYVCQLMKEYCGLNKLSGIHYHIDASDLHGLRILHTHYQEIDWILKALDKWNYDGTYSRREISQCGSSTWVRTCTIHNTIEFRIGEMSFEYDLLMQRIYNCCNIAKKYKKQCHDKFR